MDTSLLPWLLGAAWLLPLLAFTIILLAGPLLKNIAAWGVSIPAILGAATCSYLALIIWLMPGNHWPEGSSGHGEHHAAAHGEHEGHAEHAEHEHEGGGHEHEGDGHEHEGDGHEHEGNEDHAAHGDSHAEDGDGHGDHPISRKPAYSGVMLELGRFNGLRFHLSYYIDTLTILMFCMVTLIASCIHFYAVGYMHDELHDVTDHEVTLDDGTHPTRPGRFHRFFQYLSLFCFSMLGLVIAGNIAMVFVFWELVGICSYFLIGFYIERKSASSAANKAFIVNRVGDFGMIIGLMALWTGLGTFSFADTTTVDEEGNEHVAQGIFSQVRSDDNHQSIVSVYTTPDGTTQSTPHTPAGLVKLSARNEMRELVSQMSRDGATKEEIDHAIEEHVPMWRDPVKYRQDLEGEIAHSTDAATTAALEAKLESAEKLGTRRFGYGMLIIAGLGIFCGCIGKSAQFPLHTWLPDAMEGPTPVSALVHSATMVAAGVYLVGRFFPVFAPEVLLVIAAIGTVTLFMAATIAIVATDIKRVLAYSTISQLGYMMLALGVGGWVAGLMHLITHAFFKSLLFMCSGSVIHAVHTNEMPEMGGLLKKMPITAITMLIGCLAIAGASIPFVIGLSGYYSKDAILEQAFFYMQSNHSAWLALFFVAAAGGAAITAFYMFRLWFMTFLGKPRDQAKYDHAHESPKTMTVPLMICAFFAITVAWSPFQFDFLGSFQHLSLANLLEQARPDGTLGNTQGVIASLIVPDEHGSHVAAIKVPVTLLAFGTALGGIGLAAAFYVFGYLDPRQTRRQFSAIYHFLLNKWWFDELYDWLFVKPAHVVAKFISFIDQGLIDRLINNIAFYAKKIAVFWDRYADRGAIDGLVNSVASFTFRSGISLRSVQTGRLRQYVMFIVVGLIAVFLLLSFFWSSGFAK